MKITGETSDVLEINRVMLKWLKRQLEIYYPPPVSDEEWNAARDKQVRRLVELKLGCGYITQEEIDERRERVLKMDFTPVPKDPAWKFPQFYTKEDQKKDEYDLKDTTF